MPKSAERCPFSCSICSRTCRAAQRQSHRFDCCGEIAAHVPTVLRPGTKNAEKTWTNFTDPMRSGYLTGPSQTTRKAA